MELSHLIPLLTLLLSCTSASEDKKIVFSDLPQELSQQITYETEYESYALPFIARDLDFLSSLVERIGNPMCREQCKLVIAGLHNLTVWAVEFYDSSGKLPEGLLSGSTYHLGNFDECLGIGLNADDATPSSLRGQYCLGSVKIDVPDDAYDELKDTEPLSPMWRKFMRFEHRYDDKIDVMHWGICVPDACTYMDVEDMIDTIFANTLARTNFDIRTTIKESDCYRNETVPVNSYEIAYLAVISTVLAGIVVGTIFDVFFVRADEVTTDVLPQVLLAFSMPRNLRKLFSPAHEEFEFECISGIKFLTMLFILSGHTLVFVISGPVLNQKYWHEAIGRFENSIFLNSPLLVDTFLLLGGFLFSRIILQELDQRKFVNFGLLCVFRYIRLTPAYMVMIGLYVTWLPKLDSGPLWSRMKLENERCRASWWANLLYVNNYVNTDQICMFQSWYLAVESQLFLLASIVVYPLWKWRRVGQFILAAVMIVAAILPFTMTLIQDLDPTLLVYTQELRDISAHKYYKATYIKTHMRAVAYCFGLLFGYIVYRIQNSNTKISKVTVRICWLLSSSAMLLTICSVNVFYGPMKNFTTVEAALYSSLHRVLWGLGIGWVIVACITDNSGPLRQFLKWRPFVPLSRLTYSAYLVNGLVELHSASMVRVPRYLDNLSLFGKVLSHLMLAFLGAILLSVMFESPILGLERIFLYRRRKLSVRKKTDIEETTTTES